MFETRSSANTAAPFSGLLDVSSAPVNFGYYEENATDAETIVRLRDEARPGPVGWWNRHRVIGTGVGMALVLTLGLLPAVQNALLMGLAQVL
ncbi:hypothetical protein [Nocardia altamirensis]|uniref:hypothetical protein n=1 Tax=Nocardia altamirensis TaxID=472158 RepID=UPI00083FE488|nr:hypothetical protein [Nocardia altamirensis]